MHINLEAFPTWAVLQEQEGNEKAAQMILSGGEDYALLFTASADMQGLESIATCIGSCVEGASIEVFYQGEKMDVGVSGYDHFAS